MSALSKTLLDRAKALTDYAALRAYTGKEAAVTLSAAGISGTFVADTGDITSADNGATIIVDGNGMRRKRVFDGPINVKWFGAKGDGITSDVAAFQAAFSDGREVEIGTGTYLLDAAINIAAGNPRTVRGNGTVTFKVGLAANTNLISSYAAISFENVTFDFGNGFVKIALYYRANCGSISLKKVNFQNIRDTKNTYGSFVVYIDPQGNRFDLDGLAFSNLLKTGNGVITDSNGSLNCIYVGGNSMVGIAAVGTIKRVSFVEIHNIDRSGNLLYEDTTGIYIATPASDQDNSVGISDVYGYNFGKRLIKVQASNVTARNVIGYAPAGDSSSVIAFMSDAVLGDKFGNAATDVWAYGNMEYAFTTSAQGTKFKNVIAANQPGLLAGMSNAAFGILIAGNNAVIENYESNASRAFAFGSATQIIMNTRIKNMRMTMRDNQNYGIGAVSTITGYDGLEIDGLYIDYQSTATGIPIDLETYFHGTTITARNLVLKNVQVVSNGRLNAYGILRRPSAPPTSRSITTGPPM
ncbi:hypothetical protein [Cupriavidus basilensis]|uniref:Pectate lyase superfamily protein domain-containing protein n=1 Tax=Cupriavidus basilensis TaxID=68895 RepID=A0A643FT67_9BURK|nr:hypothetical protein [Cupriavidus basilensis]QOT80673.1 hypothetical protein F7R26_024930 [Cupriavidus basilensis]